MRNIFHCVALFAMCSSVGAQSAQTELKAQSLCFLQKTVTEGNHETVRVSGVFSEGLERGTLEDAACPGETTWVELALRSGRNKEKLRRFLDNSRRASVVFEGEFYGPPVPDPKLPEGIRKNYHPGWGHLGAFKTKLVVQAIRDVAVAPPAKP
jgi:hypothetical protein